MSTIEQLVDDTLAWVTYGEPNPTDLIALATSHYGVIAKDLGFKADDDTIIATAQFLREDSQAACTIRIASAIEGPVLNPLWLSLEQGKEALRFEDHARGLAAFYQWCETGEFKQA